MEPTGNTQSAPPPKGTTDWRPSTPWHWLGRAWQRITAFADWYSEHCWRIRAYMDLTRLDFASLHAVLSDPENHDRILAGKPPRPRCTRRAQRDR